MKVVNAQDVQPDNRPDIIFKTIFGIEDTESVKMGIAVFPPGARVPAQSSGAHTADEYSFIIKGSILVMSGGQEQRLIAQQASFIPAGEEHWAFNDGDSDCELIWSLIEK